uniref:Perilipin n=1 Tax=Naja naja TaxID=35670 RepID=A0A8C6XP52_NAJNA
METFHLPQTQRAAFRDDGSCSPCNLEVYLWKPQIFWARIQLRSNFLAFLQNIVTRVTNLPLVSSAYQVWSSVYQYAKTTYPCVNTACNIVEMVAAVAVGSARGGAEPLLPHLEPQIATVNEYACKGLDSLEKKLPILQQPTYQDSIALTKSVVSSTVNTARNAASEAKGLITHRAADMINLGKETMNDGIDLTQSVVSNTVNGVEMATLLRQAVASGVDTMLDKTEEMVDYYLPMSEEELGKSRGTTSPASVDEQRRQQSYFLRLGSLSSKLRSRVYRHSLNRLHVVQENTQDLLGQLQYVINLVSQPWVQIKAQQKLNQILLKWIQSEEGQERRKKENVESATLAMLRSLIQDLSPAYTWLMSTVEVLPRSLRERVDRTQSNLHHLHRSFSTAESFQDLPSGFLTQSQEMISQARDVLHTLAEHLVQITPLNWIVGPFRPQEGGPATSQEENRSAWIHFSSDLPRSSLGR